MVKVTATESDLVAMIQAEEPNFNPEAVSDGRHPYKKVDDACLYPETKAIPRAKKVEHQVLDTHANLQWLLGLFGAKIRFNRMNWTREVEIPGSFIYRDDAQNSALALVDYIATMNDFPTKKLDQHLSYIAQQQSYHPVIECLEAKPWDGIPRLDAFTETLKTDQPYAKHIVRTWMVAAIAAAHSQEGFVNQGVLVLQGAQNIGKTTWVRNLDPTGLQCVKEGAFLDPGQKDSIIMMSSYWIVELGELETIFKKSDIGRLKAFVTTQFDHVRFSFARKPTKMPRRSVYIATVNDYNFLSDDTGNRRWWTLRLSEINNNHGLDMQQVWAEVYALWQAGHITYLSKELQEKINESNEEHEKVDPFMEMLSDNYDWETSSRRFITSTTVLQELGFANPGRSDATRMGGIIKKFTGKEGKRYQGKTLHEIPFKLLNKKVQP